MATSNKLAYLNTTKQEIKQELNNLGADITDSDTFRSYANALDDIYDKLPKVSDTDTDILLTPTLEARLGLVPRGNISQSSTTGKNLFKFILSATKSGITFTNNGDEGYTLNGTATANTSFYVTNVGYSSGQYTLSANNAEINSGVILQLETSSGNKNFALSATNASQTYNCDDINVLAVIVQNGTTLNNFVIKPQLELGSTATSYEPYTGGQASPSPSYPQNISVVTGENSVKVQNRNLFTYANNFSSGSNNGINVVKNDDGTISYTGSAQSGTNVNVWLKGLYGDWNKTLIENALFTLPAGTTITVKDFRLLYIYEDLTKFSFENNTRTLTQKAYIMAYRAPSVEADVTYENTKFYPQLEIGTTATDYVEHEEQNYPLSLKSWNLLNYNLEEENYFYNASGVKTYDENNTYINQQIKTDDITNIFFSADNVINSSSVRVCEFNSNGVFIKRTLFNNTEYNLTLDSNTSYIIVSINKSNTIYFVNPQIVEGNKVKEYRPYFNIELAKIGDYEDYIEGTPDNWKKKEYIGKVVLDGTENWDTQNNVFVFNFDDIIQTPAYSFIYKIYLYCSHFLAQGTNYRTQILDLGIAKTIDSAKPKQIGINYSALNNDVNAFKTFLQTQYNNGAPVIIYYVLAASTEVPITDTTLISQLNVLYYANSYDEETNISTTYESDNASMRFTASALKGEVIS